MGLLSFATRTRAGGRREPFSGHQNIDRCWLGAISCGSERGAELRATLQAFNDWLSVLDLATHCHWRDVGGPVFRVKRTG
jgi:hypothetical protein